MKLLKFILFPIIFFFACSAEAHIAGAGTINTKPLDKSNSWVVLPGTRLVAGNPNQNEFYIVSGTAPVASPVVSNNKIVAKTVAMKQTKPKILKKPEVAKLNFAIRKTLHRVASKKHPANMRLAVKNKKHKMAVKTPLHKAKLAHNKTRHKLHHALLSVNN